jgi:hypothetical protein
MNTILPTLDIKSIVNKAHLHNARCPKEILTVMLFQCLRDAGHDVKLHFKMIGDPGRSVQENVFAFRYQGDLWTVHGKGDWDYQLTQAMKQQSQTWKNPTYVNLPVEQENEIAHMLAADSLRIHDKIRERIVKSVSLATAKTLENTTAATTVPRRSPRL